MAPWADLAIGPLVALAACSSPAGNGRLRAVPKARADRRRDGPAACGELQTTIKLRPVDRVSAGRALNTAVSLGIDIDFNPGPKSRWVLYGDARALHFNDASFGTVYTNILDHIPQPSRFFDEAHRVLSRNGTLIVDVSYNVPDKWSVATWQEQVAHISQELLLPRWGLITKEEVKEVNDNPTLPRRKGKMCYYIVKRGGG